MGLILGVLVARLLGNKKVNVRRSFRKAKKESKFLITLFTEIGLALYKLVNKIFDCASFLIKSYNNRNKVVVPSELVIPIKDDNIIDFATEFELRKAK